MVITNSKHMEATLGMEQKLGTLLGLVFKNQESTRADFEDEQTRRVKADKKLQTRIKANEETTQARLRAVQERELDMQSKIQALSKTVRQSETSIERRFDDTRFLWIGFKQEVKEMVQEDMSEVIERLNDKIEDMEEDLETFRMEHDNMKKKVRQKNRKRKAKSKEAVTKKGETKTNIKENDRIQEKKEGNEKNNIVETFRDTEDKIETQNVLKPKLQGDEYEIEAREEEPKSTSKRNTNLINFGELRNRYDKELAMHMGALLKVLEPKAEPKSELDSIYNTEDTESCSIYSSEEESELENATLDLNIKTK